MATRKNKNVVKVIALVTFLPALYAQIIWLVVANAKGLSGQNDKINAFLNHFPGFIKSISEITYITLMCAAIAIISSVKWKNKSVGFEKTFAIIIMSVSILVALLTLFQLM